MNPEAHIPFPEDLKAGSPKDTPRSRFFLQTLHEAKQEFQHIEDIEKMMEFLLLTAMGSLGVSQGFALMTAPASDGDQAEWMVIRGRDRYEFREHLSGIIRFLRINHHKEKPLCPIVVSKIRKEELPDSSGFFSDRDMLLQWRIEEQYAGIIRLGEKIVRSEYEGEESEFLFNLLNIFAFSLHKLHFRSLVLSLDELIAEKTEELNLAERQSDDFKKKSDRRIFLMQNLCDLTQDMADLKDRDRIRETFLITTAGMFSAEKALVSTMNPHNGDTGFSCRGIVKEKTLPPGPEEFDMLMKTSELLCSKSKHAQIITDKNILKRAVSQFEPDAGLIFAVKEDFLGFIALGEKITGEDYSDEDRELLLTLTHIFMIFMEKARSFEMIEKLNSDLENRNTVLNRTVKDLREKRQQIVILEKAKECYDLFVHTEKEKSGRVSVTDILLILCFGVVLGVIYNFSSPTGIELIPRYLFQVSSPRISLGLAKLKYDEGNSLFADARTAEFYKRKHIRNAVNLPLPLFDFVYLMKFAGIDPETQIIVYGRTISRHYDEEAAVKLRAKGHPNVKVMTEGLEGWEAKGFPVSDEN